ncbi:hypothetical protein ACFQVA_33905 [Actinomadura keratinilytica]
MPGGHLAAGSLTVDVAEGYGASRILGLTVPKRGSLAGLAAVTGSPVSTSDIRTDPRAHPFDAIPATGADGPDPAIGPVVAVPLQVGSGRQGALRLGRIAGRASFDDSDVELVSASPTRPPSPSNWPAGAPSRRSWWSSTTATASPATCTTWPFSGSSPPA